MSINGTQSPGFEPKSPEFDLNNVSYRSEFARKLSAKARSCKKFDFQGNSQNNGCTQGPVQNLNRIAEKLSPPAVPAKPIRARLPNTEQTQQRLLVNYTLNYSDRTYKVTNIPKSIKKCEFDFIIKEIADEFKKISPVLSNITNVTLIDGKQVANADEDNNEEDTMAIKAHILQNQVESLQWQLRQKEKAAEMSRSILVETEGFLGRFQSHLKNCRQEDDEEARKEKMTRSKSLYLVNDDSKCTEFKMTQPQSSRRNSNMSEMSFEDVTWRRASKKAKSQRDIAETKLKEEAYRLLRHITNLLRATDVTPELPRESLYGNSINCSSIYATQPRKRNGHDDSTPRLSTISFKSLKSFAELEAAREFAFGRAQCPSSMYSTPTSSNGSDDASFRDIASRASEATCKSHNAAAAVGEVSRDSLFARSKSPFSKRSTPPISQNGDSKATQIPFKSFKNSAVIEDSFPVEMRSLPPLTNGSDLEYQIKGTKVALDNAFIPLKEAPRAPIITRTQSPDLMCSTTPMEWSANGRQPVNQNGIPKATQKLFRNFNGSAANEKLTRDLAQTHAQSPVSMCSTLPPMLNSKSTSRPDVAPNATTTACASAKNRASATEAFLARHNILFIEDPNGSYIKDISGIEADKSAFNSKLNMQLSREAKEARKQNFGANSNCIEMDASENGSEALFMRAVSSRISQFSSTDNSVSSNLPSSPSTSPDLDVDKDVSTSYLRNIKIPNNPSYTEDESGFSSINSMCESSTQNPAITANYKKLNSTFTSTSEKNKVFKTAKRSSAPCKPRLCTSFIGRSGSIKWV